MGVQVQAPQSESILTTKAIIKMFGPIVLFSIFLPFVDILTDLRLIIQLYFGYTCIEFQTWSNISWSDLRNCQNSDDLSTFCHLHSNLCETKFRNFAILLFGKYTNL